MAKKPGSKAKKRLPTQVEESNQKVQKGKRAKTTSRDEVRRETTRRQGHPK